MHVQRPIDTHRTLGLYYDPVGGTGCQFSDVTDSSITIKLVTAAGECWCLLSVLLSFYT